MFANIAIYLFSVQFPNSVHTFCLDSQWGSNVHELYGNMTSGRAEQVETDANNNTDTESSGCLVYGVFCFVMYSIKHL